MTKFVVSFDASIQLTEDHWGMRRHTKVANEDTTLGEIKQWYLSLQRPHLNTQTIEPILITESP